jgi:dipeptide/tripeptide permease
MASHDSFEKEYLDVSTNMRHYANMRFAQLTLALAATGALVNSAFGRDKPIPREALAMLEVFGIIFIVVFWIMEERSADYWHRFARRAEQLECILGFEQYKRRPSKKIITATNAVRALYSTIILGWSLVLVWTHF